MFKNWDWEDRWAALALATVAGLMATMFTFFFVKKPTIGYSLGDNEGHLTIVREIEWSDDDIIDLDRSVPYWDAIRMVDSLNKTLK